MTERFSEIIDRLNLNTLTGFAWNEDLIMQAFLHPSFCMEHPGNKGISPYLMSNQRLEFLGDAILGFMTAQRLFHDNPLAQEGDLTKQRASLVCEQSLAAAASVLGLGAYIKLGRGIAADGGAEQPSILADTFESLLGALYLCGASLPALTSFVFQALENSRHLVEQDADYKGQLQALVQKTNGSKLSYAILKEEGPDHRKHFLAAAYVDQSEVGRGWGNTKQEAQKAAAKEALAVLVPGSET